LDNELKEQIIETLKSYLEYSETMFESVKKDIENGEEISSERANNINDCVRTIHHIVSIVEKVKETAPEVPVQEQWWEKVKLGFAEEMANYVASRGKVQEDLK